MYDFQGTITEDQNGSALSGVQVDIFQKPFDSQVVTSNYELAGSAVTDANGNFSVSFERTKVTEFKVHLNKENYFKQDIIIGSGEVSSENVNQVDVELQAKSFMKFTIQNTGTASQSDNLNLLLLNPKTDCDNCPQSDSYFFEGVVDTTVVYPTDAGRYYNFTYIHVGVTSASDSVYITPFDTINYTINY